MRAFFLLFPVIAMAQPVEIPADIVERCKQEGCLIILPEGHIIPRETMNQIVLKLQNDAYDEGVKDGAKTCKRKSV